MNPWNQVPRAAGDRRIEIVRVPTGSPWLLQVTANGLASVLTHFADGRTQPCLAPWDMACRACAKGLSSRVEGYLGCRNLTKGADQVVTLPERGVEQLDALLGERLKLRKLRGACLRVFRESSSRRSPLTVEHAGESPAGVPPGLDVPLVLCRAWGMPALLEKWRALLAAAAG